MPGRTKSPHMCTQNPGTGKWEITHNRQIHEWREVGQEEGFLPCNSKVDDKGSFEFFLAPQKTIFNSISVPLCFGICYSHHPGQPSFWAIREPRRLLHHTKLLSFTVRRLQGDGNVSISHSICLCVISFMVDVRYFTNAAWATCALDCVN